MNSEPVANRCPQCGAELPVKAPQGLCPKCLLSAVAEPTEPGAGHPHRPPPPTLAEVRAAFPQLEVIEMIGQGGMGAVFKARQPQLGRLVALKILPEGLSRDAAFADRFVREAQMLARLHHPNVVMIHDFGQVHGFFYLLMEYVEGVNLRQAMAAGRFTPEQALAIVPMICDALQYAHEEGVLHRDIKPENILLDLKGKVRLVDFGIAKLANTVAMPEPGTTPNPGDVTLTQAGAALGTPNYMAPEQRLSPSSVDQRADIYSLGVVFYELLTGELPAGRVTPPSRKTPVDSRIDDVVMRALARQKEKRFPTVAAVKTAVEAITTPPVEPLPAVATGAPLALSAWARNALLAGFVLLDGQMAYEAMNSGLLRALWWRFQNGWGQSSALVVGLLTIGVLATSCWRRRRWLLAPFEPSADDLFESFDGPGRAVTVRSDMWLRTACLVFLALLAVQCVWMLVSGVILLVQSTASVVGLMAASWLLPLGIFVSPPALVGLLLYVFVRRELRRKEVRVAAPAPPWLTRVAVGFVALAVVISVRLPQREAVSTVIGIGGFVAVGALAILTRSRLWRAIALAVLTEMLVVGIVGMCMFIAMRERGQLGAEWLEHVGPLTQFELSLGVQLGSLCGFAAGLAALLRASTASAFGIPLDIPPSAQPVAVR